MEWTVWAAWISKNCSEPDNRQGPAAMPGLLRRDAFNQLQRLEDEADLQRSLLHCVTSNHAPAPLAISRFAAIDRAAVRLLTKRLGSVMYQPIVPNVPNDAATPSDC